MSGEVSVEMLLFTFFFLKMMLVSFLSQVKNKNMKMKVSESEGVKDVMSEQKS